MLEQPPSFSPTSTATTKYCARCTKCLDDEPVPIRCEICNQQICNNCRSIDSRKRTIIATSLTKGGGGKQPSGRLLNMLGSKLSVLTAFRSGLSKSSFEFDELEEEEQTNWKSNKRPQSASGHEKETDNEFDKYFDQQNHLDVQNQDKQYTDKHLLDKHQFKHNKIEKQLSFQHTNERRRRLSNYRLNEGGSLDIDNSKMSSNLLSVPTIDQQQKQSHSDSQLNRQTSIDQQSKIVKTNSSDHMSKLDLNNNLSNQNQTIVRSRLKVNQLNRMVSLDDRNSTYQQQIRKSPVHQPLERSNTVDHYENTLAVPRLRDNLKANDDFILSICVMCAKNFRTSNTGGEWMKKITRSASEKLRRSGSISRTLIRSGLIKTQSNLATNQTPIINTDSSLNSQIHSTAYPNAPAQHRHSTDAGSLTSSSKNSFVEQNLTNNLNNLELNQSNNNLPIFKSSSTTMPTSSGILTVTTNIASSAIRSAHAQLTQVNSSPLPSTAHRLHQPVYNQSSQPIANYIKSPPPLSPTPTPNVLNQTQITPATNEYDINQNYFQNLNSTSFDQTYDQSYDTSLTMQAQPIHLASSNALAGNLNANSNQSSYITPKYVRDSFVSKKLPTIDCNKISSMNPLTQQQFGASNIITQSNLSQQFNQARNPLASTVSQLAQQKSPPSSGSSLETNSPRSAMTTINSSSNSLPHPHQAQSSFQTSTNVSQSSFNQNIIPGSNNINNIGNTGQTTNLLNNSLGAMTKVLSDLVSSDTRSAAIQELRETVYRKVSTRFRSSSSTSSSSTSSSCSLSNYPSVDSHHIYHPSTNLYNVQQLQSIPQQQQQQHQIPLQNIYHPQIATNANVDQTNIQMASTGRPSSGRQLPHIPGQQSYYQFHNQLNQQQPQAINQFQNVNDNLESNSPSPKTPLSRAQSSKLLNALNNSTNVTNTAFRFPPVLNSSPPVSANFSSAATNNVLQQQSSDEYSTTMSSHRSRSSSSDIGYEENQPLSPIPHNLQQPPLNRYGGLQSNVQANLRTESARNRRISPLRKQRAIHLADEQQHFNIMNMQQQTNIQNEIIQDDPQQHFIASGTSASLGCSPLHKTMIPASSTVKTQRNCNLAGFSPETGRLQQAKSYTMLQQPQQSNQYSTNTKSSNDRVTRWNWRENRAGLSPTSNGLFRCKSACETNIKDKPENEATIEQRTGCVFRKMTIKRRDRSYHALDINDDKQQVNQARKLSFNPDVTDQSNPITSAQQIANFFKEPVHKSHSEDSKANRKDKEAILHYGSSGSDPLIHRKLGSFLPHISVSDYSASSRRPSAVEDNLENDDTMLNSRFNSNNLPSSDASQTSTSRTSLHDALSSSNSSSAGLGSTTASNLLSNSSTFDDYQQHQTSSTHHLQQPEQLNKTARRNSSENKLNPNAMIYRQSRSLSNSAHSAEIEDQLLEKSFYSQPTLLSKNVSVDRLYPVLNNSKQKQQTLFPTTQNTFGEILVSVYYNTRIQTLEIKVKEARNLIPIDSKLSSMFVNQIIRTASQSSPSANENLNIENQTKATNPYVKTYLLPDRSSNSKRKTRAKMDTLNPVFNDLLSYIVDCKDIHNRTLWLTVWHWDKFSPNQCLGELILSLDNHNLNDNEYKWYPLKRRNQSRNLIDLPFKKSWPHLETKQE